MLNTLRYAARSDDDCPPSRGHLRRHDHRSGSCRPFRAFYAGLREARVKLIDSLEELGGQVAALYPEKYIYDVGGFPKVLGRDLVRNLAEQGLQFGAKVCLGERVNALRHFDQLKIIRLTTEPGHEHWSRTVVISAGVGPSRPRS